jgi:CarboxypepD_reg-like domain/TonB-dependent Receptor Plug Domain
VYFGSPLQFFQAMKFLKTALLLCLYSAIVHSQLITISGKVVEAESGESIVGAVVYWSNGKQSVVSDQYGHFVILGELGQKELKCNYPTYKPYSATFTVLRDTTITINLSPTTLQEVVIKDSPPNRQAVFLSIPINQLKRLPMLLGETDLLKALTFTPGIMVGQEGTSGLYVRGSSPDQNLFLINGATLYKSSHLFGFLSSFNGDVIEKVELYKGAFPARFGGRLSSVLDIKLKTASMTKYQVAGSVGIITSRLLVELPLIKNRLSILLAARRSYFNIFTRLFNGSGTSEAPNYYFYDFNGNMSLRVGKKSLWQVYSYQDKDYLSARGDDDLEKNRYQ